MEASLEYNRPGTKHSNYFLRAFLAGLALAFMIFLPFIVVDGGRFLFYGDFNVQQVPFYRLAHDAVRAGNIGWNQYTDLGANFIGSYSFYLLGSPFFWLTIPFPGEWLQFLMGPLFILKFGCATLTGYVYLHRYAKAPQTALIGALLYAFSGFSVYNVFFNHFHEAIIFFPLLLAALDEYMATRRRGIFALSVAACCIVNYYFFVGMVTFCVIYFIIRMVSKSWRISVRDFLLLALEAVLGLGISCILLVPSVLAITQNYRVSNPINGWNALLYDRNQRYVHIIECFFFPPDLPARPNFTPDSESKWSSLGAWLPMFSMAGVIGWLQLHRRHWLKKILWALFFMALVPGLNAAFQLFNASYYARWFYMLTLMMAAATMMALENPRVNWRRSLKWTAVITAGLALVVGLMPVINKEDGEILSVTFGLERYPTRFWCYVAVALISLALTAFLFTFYVRGSKRFFRATAVCLSAVIVLYSVYFIALGKTQSAYSYDHIIPYALNGGADVAIDDVRDDEVRVDFYESLDNSAMFWGVKSIQAFHSIVPGSVMEFYDTIGVQRDVASRPDTSHYGLRALTSVKYLFDSDHDDNFFAGEDYASPSMPGWMYYGNANGFDIWENENYIPMGFTYDRYVTETTLTDAATANRELLMLKALVLSEEQIRKWGDMLTELPAEERMYSDDRYAADCAARAALTCDTFAYTNRGFTATITASRDVPVFFSVPYEDGWSAYVNGERVDVERVNVGFMAVRVNAGTNVQIEFVYETPGLLLGILITIACLVLLGLYLLCMRAVDKYKRPMVIIPHNMRLRSLSEYAELRGGKFEPGAPIRIKKPLSRAQKNLEKKEGFTDGRK